GSAWSGKCSGASSGHRVERVPKIESLVQRAAQDGTLCSDGSDPSEILGASDPAGSDHRSPRHLDEPPDRLEVGAREAAHTAQAGVDVPGDVETGQPGHRLGE